MPAPCEPQSRDKWEARKESFLSCSDLEFSPEKKLPLRVRELLGHSVKAPGGVRAGARLRKGERERRRPDPA